jgi:hypothetical protein
VLIDVTERVLYLLPVSKRKTLMDERTGDLD